MNSLADIVQVNLLLESNSFSSDVNAMKNKLWNRPFFKAAMVAGAILIAILAYWNLTSSYLEIYIPVASYHDKDIWSTEGRGSYSYIEGGQKYYVLRYTGTSYYEVNKWNWVSEIAAYFDEQMTNRGWERSENIYTEGDPAAPETEFLPYGDGDNDRGYVVYVKKDDLWGKDGHAVVAISRIAPQTPSCCRVDGFHISLTTVRPSLMTQINSNVD